jgi:hypothetical protein
MTSDHIINNGLRNVAHEERICNIKEFTFRIFSFFIAVIRNISFTAPSELNSSARDQTLVPLTINRAC